MSWIKGTTYESDIPACHGYMESITEQNKSLCTKLDISEKNLSIAVKALEEIKTIEESSDWESVNTTPGAIARAAWAQIQVGLEAGKK